LRWNIHQEMAGKGIRKKIIEKLHNKFRLIIYNDTTLQSVWNIKLTPLMLFTVVSLFSALMIFLVIFLIASTPLKEYIPGYPKAEVREMFLKNYILVDSLEKELATRDKFFENIQSVINGEIPREDYQESDSSSKAKRVEIKTTDYDSLFQDKILEERLSLSTKVERDQSGIPEKLHFFPPMKGLVTNNFDIRKNHFGIDLVGQPGSMISAVLGGTVLFAGWTLETGNVIFLLHGNGLTSAYKHNAELLKKVGDLVKAGEAIAIIGNSGELSTGPHLHFELWYNGQPIDPEKYIVF
jgi:murein DD-endopeptidase MepM/ murein hydrolase activator NlpD